MVGGKYGGPGGTEGELRKAQNAVRRMTELEKRKGNPYDRGGEATEGTVKKSTTAGKRGQVSYDVELRPGRRPAVKTSVIGQVQGRDEGKGTLKKRLSPNSTAKC